MNEWRDELRGILSTVAATTELPDLIGELARADAIARKRLEVAPQASVPEPPTDRLLTADEVAERLNLSVDRVYRDAREGRFPFMRRLGGNTVRFSELGLEEWLRSR